MGYFCEYQIDPSPKENNNILTNVGEQVFISMNVVNEISLHNTPHDQVLYKDL